MQPFRTIATLALMLLLTLSVAAPGPAVAMDGKEPRPIADSALAVGSVRATEPCRADAACDMRGIMSRVESLSDPLSSSRALAHAGPLPESGLLPAPDPGPPRTAPA